MSLPTTVKMAVGLFINLVEQRFHNGGTHSIVITKNSGPGSILMQVLQKKVYKEKYEIPLG